MGRVSSKAGPGAATRSGLEPSATGTRTHLSSFPPSRCRGREPSGQRGLACRLNQGQEVHQQGKWALAMAGRQVPGRGATDPSCLRAGVCCPRGDGEGPGRLSRQPHPRAWGAAAQLLEDKREWQAGSESESEPLITSSQGSPEKGSQRDIYRSTGGDL